MEAPPMTSLPLVVPEALSQSTRKRWFFGHETYFREAWHAWVKYSGESAAISKAQQHTFLLLKPDAVVARAVSRTVARLREAGFCPIWVETLRFDRLKMRELWRYDLNIATLQRLAAIDLLLPATESIVLLLRDLRYDGRNSAAHRLSEFKGPSLSHLRQPGQLRSSIGAKDGLLNFIHTPDEPADLVRELAVLFDAPALRAALDSIFASHEVAADTTAAETRCYSEAAEHDLDVAASTRRILAAVERNGGNTRSTLPPIPPRDRCADWQSTLADLAAASAKATHLEWDQVVVEFFRLARRSNAGVLWPDTEVRLWDAIVFAAGHTVSNLDQVQPMLETECTLQGAGRPNLEEVHVCQRQLPHLKH
jgi:nucleoside diphosphate kinase